MHLSVLLTSLPMPFAAALTQAQELGFRYVDIVADADRPVDQLDALADSGLLVWSARRVGKNLPPDWVLDAPGAGAMRRDTLDAMKRQVDDAALLGAQRCPDVVSGPRRQPRRPGPLPRRGVPARPRRRPDAADLRRAGPGPRPGDGRRGVAWLERVGHDNLLLLLDAGHCLISDEDPAQAALRPGRGSATSTWTTTTASKTCTGRC